MGLELVDFHGWQLLTRLGEMQILVPAALLAIWRMRQDVDARPLAGWWLVSLGIATLITTATKVAFIGWGIGIAQLDFTGISGHAMFAGAIYPVLLSAFASHAKPIVQRFAIAAGFLLALLIGLSRSMVDAHSVSEIVAGLLLGGVASMFITIFHRLPRGVMGPKVAVIVLVWLLAGVFSAPESPAHALVTKIALTMSGNSAPFTREDLLKMLR